VDCERHLDPIIKVVPIDVPVDASAVVAGDVVFVPDHGSELENRRAALIAWRLAVGASRQSTAFGT
jgi:hypothetical protein